MTRHPVPPKHKRTGDEHHRRTERQQWIVQNKIARCSNKIAGIGVAFSIIAAIGAFVAACYAGGAYHQSRRQADIAQDQEHRQLRAYVYAIPSVQNFVVGQYPYVQIELKNGGQTPAYNPSFMMAYTPEPPNLSGPLPSIPGQLSVPVFTPDGTGQFIYQDHTLNESMPDGLNRAVTQSEFDAIMTSKSDNLYIWGRVEYLDAFGHVWHTNFCFTLGASQVNQPPGGYYGYCATDNDAN